MKLLAVIPIKKGINKETLSYFTGSDIPAGSVVKVPLRKKTISAIVASSEDVIDVKAEIKNASFETRRVEKIKSTTLLSPEFMKAVAVAAHYFVSTSGSILNSLIPNSIIEGADSLNTVIKPIKTDRAHEKLILQNDDDERYATYKSLIREEFARGYSVFFCLPTVQDIKKAHEKISKGIEQYTFMLHGLLSKKEQLEIWSKATSEEHPSLIISTGTFLGIPRNDIGTIIVDKENTRAYKNQTRPFIDIRTFAEILGREINARVVFGDLLLRTETVWRHNQAEIFEVAPLKFRSLTTCSHELIDMKAPVTENKAPAKEPKFKLLSTQFIELVKKNQDNDENLFVFVARRGLFPSTVCADCGTLVICNTCGAPTVLHKGTTENFFLCHRCGEHRSAIEKCRDCNSWKLATFGIGIEAVSEEIKNLFPNIKIFMIDSDSASTHKKAIETVNKFYSAPGSILLGTEMALLYLKDIVANSAVVSIDSFFSIPDFRINEKVLNILLKIRASTSRHFLLQTRDSSQKIFAYALAGNLADFYRDEIKEREQLNYPPFSLPIKITLQGEKRVVLAGMEKLQKDFAPYEVDVFPAFIPIARGKFSMHALIKVNRATGIDEDLQKKLTALTPDFAVNIDPDSLL